MTETLAMAGRTVLARRRFALLLASLMALLLLVPLLGDDPRGEADAALLFSLVVLGFATAAKRTALACTVAGVWLVLTWVRPLGSGVAGEVAMDATLVVLAAVTIESALRRALTARVVDAEVICAAIAAYVLFGVGWAGAYTILETLHPGAFALSPEDAAAPWNALLYFSFTTLTTLGYGDILPAIPIARSWAMIEVVCGTFYLAILIARLVSSYTGDQSQT